MRHPLRRSVAAAGRERTLATPGQRLDQVARDERLLAELRRREVARAPVHERRRSGGASSAPCRASSEPMTPASTSPVPPVAIPGLPVGFRPRLARPARRRACAAPFSTTIAPVSRASAWAASSRSRAAGRRSSRPSRRAISPGCGVSDRRGAARAQQRPSRIAERGERVQTVGVDHERHRALADEARARTRRVASSCPRPGPSTTASRSRASASSAEARRDRGRPSPSLRAAPS